MPVYPEAALPGRPAGRKVPVLNVRILDNWQVLLLDGFTETSDLEEVDMENAAAARAESLE